MSTLAWSHRVGEIREAKMFTREADEAERARISERIGNAQCLALTAEYTVKPDGDQRFHVAGRVRARLEQICGVTLEAMFQDIDEVIDVVFEAGRIQGNETDVGFDPLEDDPPEMIVNGRIAVGEIIAEIVALAADPFPRSADSELETWESGEESAHKGDDARENPFAKLKSLAQGPGEKED